MDEASPIELGDVGAIGSPNVLQSEKRIGLVTQVDDVEVIGCCTNRPDVFDS